MISLVYCGQPATVLVFYSESDSQITLMSPQCALEGEAGQFCCTNVIRTIQTSKEVIFV